MQHADAPAFGKTRDSGHFIFDTCGKYKFPGLEFLTGRHFDHKTSGCFSSRDGPVVQELHRIIRFYLFPCLPGDLRRWPSVLRKKIMRVGCLAVAGHSAVDDQHPAQSPPQGHTRCKSGITAADNDHVVSVVLFHLT